MTEAPPDRRLSKLSVVPLVLSRCAWVCVVVAFLAFVYSFPGPNRPDRSEFTAVGVAGLVLAAGFSIVALAAGGVSFLRIQRAQPQLRGRGLAAAGCLTALPPLLVAVTPPMLLAALLAFGLWLMGQSPGFIW